ncbi:MAG: hypothetical protein SGI71_10465 [Verrucomicrobiota bacterium]|nr:hypothetical protein [Verrucomicrobiota bacterium]
MSLLKDIQKLFERTYYCTGVNFEEFIVSRGRSHELEQLCAPYCRELSAEARTYLRHHEGQLKVGIYYSAQVIETLERFNPVNGLTDHNIGSLIAFIEEINHAVHASLIFLENPRELTDENFLVGLELQGKIDTYLALCFFKAAQRKKRRLLRCDKIWLRQRLFDNASYEYESPVLVARYRETVSLARQFLDFLEELSKEARVRIIREFSRKNFTDKKQYILQCGC